MTDSASQARSPAKTPPRPTPKDVSLTERARDAANDATGRLADTVDASPLAILAGGIAVGLLAGAILPNSRREAELLGSLGAKLNDGAVTAARAAADAGKAELAAVGLSRVGANEQVDKLLDGLGKAITSAGTAARGTRKRGAASDKSGDQG